eukprot:3888686-Amphidinium_carterae.1
MIEPEAEAPAQGDALAASVESVVDPPVAQVRRVEPTTDVPKRTYGPPDQATGYGPPTPPDEN